MQEVLEETHVLQVHSSQLGVRQRKEKSLTHIVDEARVQGARANGEVPKGNRNRSGVDYDQQRLDLVSTGPLHVAGVLLDAPHVLPHFALDGFQEEVVHGVRRVGEAEFGPDEDAELVAEGVEVVTASELVRWLVDASAPNAQL